MSASTTRCAHSCVCFAVPAYLVEVDDRLPEEVAHLVEVPHSDLSEVSRMVLVHVGPVVVLATGQPTTTGMLPVLANTSVTCRDMATAMEGVSEHPLKSTLPVKLTACAFAICG